VGGLGAGLEGIELDTFASADISRIVEVQNNNRALYTDIRSTLNSLVRFINKPPQALQLIKKEAPKWVIGGTILGLMGKSGSSSINSFPRTKVISTSPQPAVPTESEKAVNEYFLVTVPDTNVEVFQAWIKGLPDKGAGVQQYYDWPRVYQTYKTKMTRQEAEIVNLDRIVGHIGANLIRIVEFDHVNTGTKEQFSSPRSQRKSNGTRLNNRSLSDIRVGQESICACSPPFPKANLAFSTIHSTTLDSTIFTSRPRGLEPNLCLRLGARLDSSAPEFAPVRGVVPMADGAEHGDRVAALAVGRIIGVAPQANLVAVKARVHYVVDKATGQHIQEAYLDDIYENWRWIVNDVRTGNPPRAGKAVLSWSKGAFYQNMFQNVEHIGYFDYDRSNGTSFAAPQIAGLAAYFLTLPTSHWEPYRVAQDMKNFIQGYNRMPPRSPDGVFVAYNGVHEILPFCPPPGPSVRAKPRSIFHRIANIFRRQKEEKEIVIFENGKLTNTEYSNQLQCQSTSSTKTSLSTKPPSSSSSKSSTSSQTSTKSSTAMQSGSPSRVTEHGPWSIQSTSSTPTSSPTRLPVTRWSGYQSGDKDNPFLAPFRRGAMSTHINNTCHDSPTWAGDNHPRIADGDNTILLHLATTALKNDIPFLESDGLRGYDTIIIDRCRTETDESWGGTVDIGNVRFDTYARKLPPVTEYTCFTTLKTPKLAEHGGGLAFNRQDMRDFIEKTCSDNAGAGFKGWKFNTPYSTGPTLKGDPDDTQTNGGQCTIDDIKYTIFSKKTT
ncbi:MAG: hypothetical protein Q9207_008063, partial [Kuettlingeria erythrocarpa]